MSLCLAVAGQVLTIAAASFSLSWAHSVERIAWTETWQVEGSRLKVVEAVVKGSGAGMEAPENAWRVAEGWAYRPEIAPLDKLVLAASGSTDAGWTFCAAGTCRELGALQKRPIKIWVSAGECSAPGER